MEKVSSDPSVIFTLYFCSKPEIIVSVKVILKVHVTLIQNTAVFLLFLLLSQK